GRCERHVQNYAHVNHAVLRDGHARGGYAANGERDPVRGALVGSVGEIEGRGRLPEVADLDVLVGRVVALDVLDAEAQRRTSVRIAARNNLRVGRVVRLDEAGTGATVGEVRDTRGVGRVDDRVLPVLDLAPTRVGLLHEQRLARDVRRGHRRTGQKLGFGPGT